jgi:hypothetical protein
MHLITFIIIMTAIPVMMYAALTFDRGAND